MDKLLTKKELAARWRVTEKAIDNWRKEGIISSIKGIPSVRFNPAHIAQLEGTKLEKFSPLERKRLLRELEQLKVENKALKEVLSKTLADLVPVINL